VEKVDSSAAKGKSSQNEKYTHEKQINPLHPIHPAGIAANFSGESFARGGRVHSAHFFELADQPVEVLIAVTTEEATRLFDWLKAENVHLFYVKTAVEFGVVGRDS
jgi:hypothetical protein